MHNREKLKAEFNRLRKWTHVTELLSGSKFVTRKKDAHSQLSCNLLGCFYTEEPKSIMQIYNTVKSSL